MNDLDEFPASEQLLDAIDNAADNLSATATQVRENASLLKIEALTQPYRKRIELTLDTIIAAASAGDGDSVRSGAAKVAGMIAAHRRDYVPHEDDPPRITIPELFEAAQALQHEPRHFGNVLGLLQRVERCGSGTPVALAVRTICGLIRGELAGIVEGDQVDRRLGMVAHHGLTLGQLFAIVGC